MNVVTRFFLMVCFLCLTGANAEPTTIKLRELYNKDYSFSAFAKNHVDKVITIQGFMAPPLKIESPFFVLTKQPMSVCPFCETDADWPTDIVAIYAKKNVKTVPYNVPIVVTGRLELGSYTDTELGFVSQVRLVDASVKKR